MSTIRAKGWRREYEEIEIDLDELDDFQLEWIVNKAREKKLLPMPRTQDQEFIEEALSLLWRKDMIGLEKLITRQLPSEVRSADDIRQEYLRLMGRKQVA